MVTFYMSNKLTIASLWPRLFAYSLSYYLLESLIRKYFYASLIDETIPGD